MDLIENLSKDFIDDLRNMLNLKVPKISIIDSNAAGAKDNGIHCEFICVNNFTLNNKLH